MTKYKVVREGTNTPAEEGNVSYMYYRNQIVKTSESDSLVRIGRPKEKLNFGVKVGGRRRGALNRDQRREMGRIVIKAFASEVSIPSVLSVFLDIMIFFSFCIYFVITKRYYKIIGKGI